MKVKELKDLLSKIPDEDTEIFIEVPNNSLEVFYINARQISGIERIDRKYHSITKIGGKTDYNMEKADNSSNAYILW